MQEAACEDAVAAYVDVAGFLFNVVKEDIICCDAGVPKWFKCSETVKEEPCEQNEVNEAMFVRAARTNVVSNMKSKNSQKATECL